MATYLKEEWLSDPLFKKWLVKDTDKYFATCRTCQVQFNLSNIGWRPLKRHMEDKRTCSEVKASILLLQTCTVYIQKASNSGSQPIR